VLHGWHLKFLKVTIWFANFRIIGSIFFFSRQSLH
jgi:hypothetical protein